MGQAATALLFYRHNTGVHIRVLLAILTRSCMIVSLSFFKKKFRFQIVVITRLLKATSVNEFDGLLFAARTTLPSLKVLSVTVLK